MARIIDLSVLYTTYYARYGYNQKLSRSVITTWSSSLNRKYEMVLLEEMPKMGIVPNDQNQSLIMLLCEVGEQIMNINERIIMACRHYHAVQALNHGSSNILKYKLQNKKRSKLIKKSTFGRKKSLK
jgi:hypothetical protein